MLTVYSVNGVRIRLTEERWGYIVAGHQDMEPHRDKVLETVRDPKVIQRGALDELIASRFYAGIEERGKYVFAVYREVSIQDGFIITAYLEDARSARKEVVWIRP